MQTEGEAWQRWWRKRFQGTELVFISPQPQWSSLFTMPPVDGAEILSMLRGLLCRMCTFMCERACVCVCAHMPASCVGLWSVICLKALKRGRWNLSCLNCFVVSRFSLLWGQSVLSLAAVQKFSSLSCLLLLEVRVGQDLMLGGRLLKVASLQAPAVNWHFRRWVRGLS